MLGLGWMELLLIGGAIMLIAGPKAAPKILASLQSMRGAQGLDKLMKMNETLDAFSSDEEETPAADPDAESATETPAGRE